MIRSLIVVLSLFAASTLCAQTVTMEVADAQHFLQNFLGAHFDSKHGLWVLPDTAKIKARVQDIGFKGLAVNVDTFTTRFVGDREEAWVLFSIEGYTFHYARFEHAGPEWQLRQMRYMMHQGAPTEYSFTEFGFRRIGGRTIISIQDQWYGNGVTNEKWHLYDPFSKRKLGQFEYTRSGEETQHPEDYLSFVTLDVEYKTPEGGGFPEITLIQQVEEKTPGVVLKSYRRRAIYHYDETAKQYLPGKI